MRFYLEPFVCLNLFLIDGRFLYPSFLGVNVDQVKEFFLFRHEQSFRHWQRNVDAFEFVGSHRNQIGFRTNDIAGKNIGRRFSRFFVIKHLHISQQISFNDDETPFGMILKILYQNKFSVINVHVGKILIDSAFFFQSLDNCIDRAVLSIQRKCGKTENDAEN